MEEEDRMLYRKWERELEGGAVSEEACGGVPAFGQFQESRTMCLSTLLGADRIQECPES